MESINGVFPKGKERENKENKDMHCVMSCLQLLAFPSDNEEVAAMNLPSPNHALQRTPRCALGLFDNVWPAPRLAGAESLILGRSSNQDDFFDAGVRDSVEFV